MTALSSEDKALDKLREGVQQLDFGDRRFSGKSGGYQQDASQLPNVRFAFPQSANTSRYEESTSWNSLRELNSTATDERIRSKALPIEAPEFIPTKNLAAPKESSLSKPLPVNAPEYIPKTLPLDAPEFFPSKNVLDAPEFVPLKSHPVQAPEFIPASLRSKEQAAKQPFSGVAAVVNAPPFIPKSKQAPPQSTQQWAAPAGGPSRNLPLSNLDFAQSSQPINHNNRRAQQSQKRGKQTRNSTESLRSSNLPSFMGDNLVENSQGMSVVSNLDYIGNQIGERDDFLASRGRAAQAGLMASMYNNNPGMPQFGSSSDLNPNSMQRSAADVLDGRELIEQIARSKQLHNNLLNHQHMPMGIKQDQYSTALQSHRMAIEQAMTAGAMADRMKYQAQRSMAAAEQAKYNAGMSAGIDPSRNPSVAAATRGGATYFFGPGQGTGFANQAFQLPGGRQDKRGRGRGYTPPGHVPLGSKFMSDDLREELKMKRDLILATADPDQDVAELPECVNCYHTLAPLEDPVSIEDPPSLAMGVRSTVFKGISAIDGKPYAIRRIDHRQVIPTSELAKLASEAIQRWSPLRPHPGVVALRDSFVSTDMEDSAAIFFVHDYYPAACTLKARHLAGSNASGVVHLTITEDQIWSYLIQLVSVLRAVHGKGMFCRAGSLHPSKVLLTSKGRVRVASLGVLDVLHGENTDDAHFLQREDLCALGRLILCLCCNSLRSLSLDFMASHYSHDLVTVTRALLSAAPDSLDGGGVSSIRQILPILGDKLLAEMEQQHALSDALLEELSLECDNGRLFRLLVKLGTVNERPDDSGTALDPNWAETGDRFLLKLFRDFVFHQVAEDGSPLVDWGHIIESLNKLDAGVPEKLTLMNRDQRSLLIVSYRDLHKCIQSSFAHLTNASKGPVPAHQKPE